MARGGHVRHRCGVVRASGRSARSEPGPLGGLHCRPGSRRDSAQPRAAHYAARPPYPRNDPATEDRQARGQILSRQVWHRHPRPVRRRLSTTRGEGHSPQDGNRRGIDAAWTVADRPPPARLLRPALPQQPLHLSMADDVTFMMGKFAARLPGDFLYARNHMWRSQSGDRSRFGFTAYAVRLMQDVYFLDWCVDEGMELDLKQKIGNIETSKAVSDLFAPIAGTMAIINRDLLKDPSAINVDGYGPGWLFEMSGDASGLMDAAAYAEFLAGEWEKAQRVIKGQINKE